MQTQPNIPHDGAVYTGYDVTDEQGHHVGKVVDVIFDDDSTLESTADERRPSWLVVDPGFLRAAHYLPVAGSYRTADGTIITPWDKEWIKSAAKATGDHILTRDQRRELKQHYALAE